MVGHASQAEHDGPDWDTIFGVREEVGSYGEGFKYGERLLEHVTDRDILDLGAGDGRLAAALAGNGNRVVALDKSEVAVGKIQGRPEGDAIEAHAVDLEDIEAIRELLGDRSFDIVTSVNVIQFMSREAVDEMFQEVRRRLTANGEFLIRGPLPKPPLFDGEKAAGKGVFTQAELTESVMRAGLTIVNFKEIEWPPKGDRTQPQPAYWAFATHNPLHTTDTSVRFDARF